MHILLNGWGSEQQEQGVCGGIADEFVRIFNSITPIPLILAVRWIEGEIELNILTNSSAALSVGNMAKISSIYRLKKNGR